MVQQYYSVNKTVSDGEGIVNFTFLGNANQKCKEAWILAKGSMLKVRLTDVTNTALSEFVELNASSLSRSKLLNVDISASEFPETINLTAAGSGEIQGILLIWE